MGMTLDAAEQLLDDDPAAARALLAEARETSVQALAELRDLVRGIHPPVLADRGLADAVRALALDSPLPVHVTRRPAGPARAAGGVRRLLRGQRAAHQRHQARRRPPGLDRPVARRGGCCGSRSATTAAAAPTRPAAAAWPASSGGSPPSTARPDLTSPPGGPTVVTLEVPCALSSPKTSSS